MGVKAKKTVTMNMRAPDMKNVVRVEKAGQRYMQVESFVYILGKSAT